MPQQNWREVVSLAALNGIPAPSFGGSLSYYDSLPVRTPSSEPPAGAGVTFFGAHTYETIR